MNAVGQGKVSFQLAIIRHLVLIIPLLLLMNWLFALNGLIWAQLVADVINAAIAYVFYRKFSIIGGKKNHAESFLQNPAV